MTGRITSNNTLTESSPTPVAFTTKSTIELVVFASAVKDAGAEKEPKASSGNVSGGGGEVGGGGGTETNEAGPIVSTTARMIARQKPADNAMIVLRLEFRRLAGAFESALAVVGGGRSTSLTRSKRNVEEFAIQKSTFRF